MHKKIVKSCSFRNDQLRQGDLIKENKVEQAKQTHDWKIQKYQMIAE